MSGLTPINIALMTQPPAEHAAPAISMPDFSSFSDNSQTAFALHIPPAQSTEAGRIDNASSLGDRVLAGLSRIGSSFSALDSLMAQAVPNATQASSSSAISGSIASPGIGQASSIPSIPDHLQARDIPALMKSVEEQGIAMYNQQFAREVKFTSAEFEAHIVTVTSQNMSSTLKSLLSQGG